MKSILIILLMSISIFADTFIFEVENTTMVDAYGNIFEAMASLFQSPDYIGLLKLAFLAGGTGVFLVGVLKSSQSSGSNAVTEFGKYMIVGTSLLTLVFSNASTIYVKTNNMPSICTSGNTSNSQLSSDPFVTGAMVANVPTTLAWTFTTLNRIGVETTLLAKTAFSTLSTSAVSEPGSRGGFASYLTGVGAVTSLSLDDITSNTQLSPSNSSTIGSTLVAITNDCILIPAGQDTLNGPDVINTMKRTGDIKLTIDELLTNNHLLGYINPTTVTPISDIPNITLGGIAPTELLVSLNGEMFACKDAYLTLKARLLSLEKSGAVECQESLKGAFGVDTINILTGGTAAGTVSNARNIALNSAMANQIFDSKRNLAIGSEVSFAAGKSMSEFTTQSLGSGYYMAQMLPYLQMGIRAVLYAFFPFVFVVILLPGGIKVLISYLQSLVWIELWTPTAAILDMFLGLVAKEKFADMYNSKGFNPTNGMQSFSDAAMLASVAGYLYASVPALTYLILKGSAQMLGNITSGVASGMSRNLDSATINRDIGDMKKLGAVNKELESKGQKMVSLAEMDSLESGHMAAQNAGAWLTNQAHVGDLVNVGKGATLGSILQAKSTQHNYGNKEGEAVFAAAAAHKYTGEKTGLKELGVMPGTNALPGEPINQDKSTKIGTIRGKEDMQKVETLGATQEKTGSGAGKTKEEVEAAQKRVSVIESTTKSADLIKDEVLQNHVGPNADVKLGTQAGLAKVETFEQFNAKIAEVRRQNPNMKSDGEAVVAAATIDGLKAGHTIAETKEQMDVYAGKGHKGTIGKDGKLHYDKEGYKNILKNKTKAVNSKAQAQLGDNQAAITENQRRIASTNAVQNKNAEDRSINEFNQKTLKAAVASGDKASIALENKIKNYSPAQKSMARAAFIKTDLGRLGDVFSKVQSSSKAKESINQGINAVKSGTMEAQILKGNAVSNSDLGSEIIRSGGSQQIHDAMRNIGLKGNYNDLSLTQKAAVASGAISLLGTTNKAFKAQTDKLYTEKIQHDYAKRPGGGAEAVATLNQSKTEVDSSYYNRLKAIAGDNFRVGEGKAVLEVGKAAKTVVSGVNNITGSMVNSKDKFIKLKDKTVEAFNNKFPKLSPEAKRIRDAYNNKPKTNTKPILVKPNQ